MAGKERNVTDAEALHRVPLRTDSAALERQTLERVGRTMMSIGNFLARWDLASKKPGYILPEIGKIRRFYEALGAWQADAAEASRRKSSEAERLRRLRRFVFICRAFS
jgi:hypothetical protein